MKWDFFEVILQNFEDWLWHNYVTENFNAPSVGASEMHNTPEDNNQHY